MRCKQARFYDDQNAGVARHILSDAGQHIPIIQEWARQALRRIENDGVGFSITGVGIVKKIRNHHPKSGDGLGRTNSPKQQTLFDLGNRKGDHYD